MQNQRLQIFKYVIDTFPVMNSSIMRFSVTKKNRIIRKIKIFFMELNLERVFSLLYLTIVLL